MKGVCNPRHFDDVAPFWELVPHNLSIYNCSTSLGCVPR